MLKKEICQRCRDNTSWKWGEDEDINWDLGKIVDCPLSDNNAADFIRFVDGLPPKSCPYLMEQLVLGDGVELPPDEWLMDTLMKQEETP